MNSHRPDMLEITDETIELTAKRGLKKVQNGAFRLVRNDYSHLIAKASQKVYASGPKHN